MPILNTFRAFAMGLGLLTLAACDARDAGDPPNPMGNFAMGLNIVVADHAQTVPISRQATAEEWKTVMAKAMQDRFGSYSGPKLFDFGVSIDGYMLAPPGIPFVASPHSAMIFTVNVWDDAKQQILVPGGKRMTYVEGISGDSIVGSGWTQNKDAQMKKLAFNAAKAVQDYMLVHPEWLDLPPGSPGSAPTPARTNASPARPVIAPATISPSLNTPGVRPPIVGDTVP